MANRGWGASWDEAQAPADPWGSYKQGGAGGGADSSWSRDEQPSWKRGGDKWSGADKWGTSDKWSGADDSGTGDKWSGADWGGSSGADKWGAGAQGSDSWGAGAQGTGSQKWGGGNGDGKWGGGNGDGKWGESWGQGDSSGDGYDVWGSAGANLDKNINWGGINLIPVDKNFYAEHPDVAARTDEEVAAIRAKHDIEVLGGNVPKPVTTFEEASLPDWLLEQVLKNNFQTPTPIQTQVWPVALQGRDLIGIAETGSGKTLAYLMPMMIHIMAQEELKAEEGPVGLVMCPTRELALQIDTVAKEFSGRSGLKSTCVYGGAAVKEQVYAVKEKNDIVIATPGRLIQLLNEGRTNLNRATYVVLDEADEMLNQGFGEQMKLILSQVRPDRQMLMFSATWPKDVQVLAGDFCTASSAGSETIMVRIGGDKLAACRTIQQHVLVLEKWQDKFEKVKEAVCRSGCDSRGNFNKCLIFCKTKAGVDDLVNRFTAQQIEVLAIHGDKRQDERIWALSQFRDGEVSCLVATNCLGRGHDIPRVKYVVNYDAPATIESYIHRIGRTGRAGEQGFALTFMTEWDLKLAPPLVEVLRQTKQQVSPELLKICQEASKLGMDGDSVLNTGPELDQGAPGQWNPVEQSWNQRAG